MEHYKENNQDMVRLTEPSELIAASYAGVAVQYAPDDRISQEQKLHGRELSIEAQNTWLNGTETGLCLTHEDFRFLSGAARFMLGSPHYRVKNLRAGSSPATLTAANELINTELPVPPKA